MVTHKYETIALDNYGYDEYCDILYVFDSEGRYWKVSAEYSVTYDYDYRKIITWRGVTTSAATAEEFENKKQELIVPHRYISKGKAKV